MGIAFIWHTNIHKTCFKLLVSNAELPDASYVRGLSSGATGHATAAGGASTIVKLPQVTGSFITGEGIIINEDPELSRSIQTRIFGVEDIKSDIKTHQHSVVMLLILLQTQVLNRKIQQDLMYQMFWI